MKTTDGRCHQSWSIKTPPEGGFFCGQEEVVFSGSRSWQHSSQELPCWTSLLFPSPWWSHPLHVWLFLLLMIFKCWLSKVSLLCIRWGFTFGERASVILEVWTSSSLNVSRQGANSTLHYLSPWVWHKKGVWAPNQKSRNPSTTLTPVLCLRNERERACRENSTELLQVVKPAVCKNTEKKPSMVC